jgi:hypothetical protein
MGYVHDNTNAVEQIRSELSTMPCEQQKLMQQIHNHALRTKKNDSVIIESTSNESIRTYLKKESTYSLLVSLYSLYCFYYPA